LVDTGAGPVAAEEVIREIPPMRGSGEAALTEKFESLKDEDTSVMVEKVVSESLAISLGSLSAGMGCSSSVSRRAEILVLKVPAWPSR
jgi:hypothetical protein